MGSSAPWPSNYGWLLLPLLAVGAFRQAPEACAWQRCTDDARGRAHTRQLVRGRTSIWTAWRASPWA